MFKYTNKIIKETSYYYNKYPVLAYSKWCKYTNNMKGTEGPALTYYIAENMYNACTCILIVLIVDF